MSILEEQSPIFCTIVVTGNLIFQKFVTINLIYTEFEISVGVILFPITFLISDLVTEFYGEKNAKFMIQVALLCSIIILVIIAIADFLPATEWSTVDDRMFCKVFNAYGVGTIASIVANYLGQSIDIKIFAALNNYTQGSHLWLRNNVSTIAGQAIDTITVVYPS